MSPTIANTLGAAFIGFAFSCVVFGMNTTQVLSYLQRYPEDRLVYKLLVCLIWVLELVDQAFIGHSVYYYVIQHFAEPFTLLTQAVVWSLIVQLTIGALIGTIVRLCFAMRVWRFSEQNIFVTAVVVVLALGELGLSIAFTTRAFQNPFVVTLPNLKLLASFSLGAGVVADVFTAAALCFFLRRFRTGNNARSDSLVNTLTIYAINTGVFTSTISLLTLIFYDRNPDTFQFIGFYFVLSKLYGISFLCTLNTRRIIRGKGTDREYGPTTGSSGISNNRFYVSRARREGNVFQPSEAVSSVSKGLEIGVHQEVSISTDMELSPTQFETLYPHPYVR
ncbi:hypothetical protein FB45DRAFT_444053 [Roridomyces roridus]|uniref:DUF6534 domain-containing protein n=1 Tax=Roridomyces roridus TaxID=1738132 RepID=A0AAD7C0S3_9AGAR|nr:hypothetical protein FB45DRAFT_444053 [Roridomyces roridus]